MAFVNRQGGEQRREESALAGETLDFDPHDPTIVKVHYDLSAWTWEQRAELSEAMAEADLPHHWDDDELVVPELVEARVDAVIERLEAELGPFAVALAEGAPSTEFGLDEWSAADRQVLSDALVESEVPFRWEGTTVVVAQDAEDAVDDLLDAIEAGELLTADEQPGAEPPDGVLSSIFLAADRLAREPSDARSRTTLLDLDGVIDPQHPPYAFSPRTWNTVVRGVAGLARAIRGDAADGAGGANGGDGAGNDVPEVDELAGGLRELLRPYV